MTERLVERVSFRDSDHSYELDGKKIPSVTTLLGNLSKPGLVWWSATEGAKALRQWWDQNATDVDLHDGERIVEVGERDIDDLYHLVRTAHNKRKTAAAAKGNAVHAAIDQYHTNFFEATPPEDDPRALKAWDAFISWWGTAGLTCVSTERIIVDPEGRYSGRLDLLCEDEHGDLFVCDIKTSNGVYPEMLMQNAGYAAAIEAELERPVAGTKVLWLPEFAEKVVVVERDHVEWRIDYEIFESLIALHAHRKALDTWLKQVKADHGPIPF